jgi:DNA processing protein
MTTTFALPELTEERARIEGLVELFVATDGLGPSRLASLADRSSLAVGPTLLQMAGGGRSPVHARPRATPWDDLVCGLRAAAAATVSLRSRARWWLRGDPGWDQRFGDDDAAPAALCVVGDLATLGAPRVAIVGTRSASAAGMAFARELGSALGEAGVAVVSGLARGIDGAAHRGATADPEASGRAIGVLGTGTSVVYPREHHALQHTVAERGLLLSEYDPGRGPRPEAFPRRNRIVAQLAQAVVVVESGTKGGSLLTVNEATMRARPVLAVPNNPLLRSATGSNALLRASAEGPPLALPCHGVSDVLAVLDYRVAMAAETADDRVDPEGDPGTVLRSLGWERRTTSAVAAATGLSLRATAGALAWLEDQRWVEHEAGRWARVLV